MLKDYELLILIIHSSISWMSEWMNEWMNGCIKCIKCKWTKTNKTV